MTMERRTFLSRILNWSTEFDGKFIAGELLLLEPELEDEILVKAESVFSLISAVFDVTVVAAVKFMKVAKLPNQQYSSSRICMMIELLSSGEEYFSGVSASLAENGRRVLESRK